MSINGHNYKILQKLKGHTSDVTCCDFAPNFTLVTGSSDKSVKIWDWIPGDGYVERQNSPLKGHKYQVTCVRVSPQGSMLASSSVDGTAVLWNIHNGSKLYTMTQVNGDAIRVCRFSPDSAILVTAGDNGAVCIWDLVHRSLIKTLFEHEGTTQSLAFTPDSQLLISACSLEFIKVWYVQDVIDTTLESCIPVAKVDNAHDLGVFCVEVSKHIQLDEENPLIRHYRLATCGNTVEIKLWNLTSKSTLKSKNSNVPEVSLDLFDIIDGHSSSVTCIRYSNNGNYLISSSVDKLVKVWDNSGTCIASLEGHNRYVNCAALSKDMTIIASGSTGSNDKQIIIWDLTGKVTQDSVLDQLRISISTTTGIQENQLVVNSDMTENDVKLLEKIDDIAEGAINSCCFNGNRLLATGSGDKLIRIFKLLEENNNTEELCFSPIEAHTYAINYVEFSNNGEYLASCSLDGRTTLWNASTGEKYFSLPKNGLSIKVCRFSPDDKFLVTAGDDEKAMVWNVETKEKLVTLEGHADSIPSLAISPDCQLLITASINSDFRVWSMQDFTCLHVQEDAHDYGIQCCDMSKNLQPIPNTVTDDQSYLLASCGNDSLVKLWRITLPMVENESTLTKLEVKLWRSLQGHGGTVYCVKFSQVISEFICSTATDRQARIWSVYSANCLFVIDHDSIVTTCAFNHDCSLLATGCQDKTLWLWKLPQQLVFQTVVAGRIQCRNKQVVDWTNSDVIKWLENAGIQSLVDIIKHTSLDGKTLLTFSNDDICSRLELDDDQAEQLKRELHWLKKSELHMEGPQNLKVPYDYMCPITHEIMREPVTCSDGYTYEKNAIAEWFMSGKYTSPMTNEVLSNTDYNLDIQLRNKIRNFLEGNVENQD